MVGLNQLRDAPSAAEELEVLVHCDELLEARGESAEVRHHGIELVQLTHVPAVVEVLPRFARTCGKDLPGNPVPTLPVEGGELYGILGLRANPAANRAMLVNGNRADPIHGRAHIPLQQQAAQLTEAILSSHDRQNWLEGRHLEAVRDDSRNQVREEVVPIVGYHDLRLQRVAVLHHRRQRATLIFATPASPQGLVPTTFRPAHWDDRLPHDVVGAAPRSVEVRHHICCAKGLAEVEEVAQAEAAP
mmetsp:Transcript_20395/g.59128  ORF Transcript_20395/g.59128 Transcript_20395/m.59128 type:complete len:246 (-) Transcript_20395:649-1386(-)